MAKLFKHPLAISLFISGLFTVQGAEKSYTIAVIPKGTTHEFWKSINAGAVKAQRELTEQGTKVEIIWKGPLREDDRDQQIQVVENFIARQGNAIRLPPLASPPLLHPANTPL